MSIEQNLKDIKQEINSEVKLVAVSKTKPIELLQEAYDAGQRVFGENKALEMNEKHQQLAKDIEWHFIGHMQTNKVKYIAPFVSLIHSVDSFKILKEINKQALKNDRIINCLLQFHIAEEETKFGLDIDDCKNLLNSEEYKLLNNVNICGLMGMATFTDDKNQIQKEFKYLKSCFTQIKEEFFAKNNDFKEISMGMSGDYKIAIEEGSTIVRVGSKIFGSRN